MVNLDSERVHSLKTWPTSFGALLIGVKRVELRKNDRGYQIGDKLILREFDPDMPEGRQYTGRSIDARVLHIIRCDEWMEIGGPHYWVAMSIAVDGVTE